MYLKSIEISGFKSFAKKSVLEFKTPITSVVGPNGSGKSNVAEAFRFVLGEQSMKSLRSKRGEDLIWNGGANEPRANRASAKIAFDNSNRSFDLDYPEVTLERIVNRDGTNEYLLNGSQVRLRDIYELLAGAHIGASGHHIISQGEAERILSASPRDRRSLIEDALGLKLYQYKREESEKKLEKTRENIAQVESLRREIAPHLRFLSKQMEKFAKAESEKDRLIELAKEYFRAEDHRISEEKGGIETERKPIGEKLAKLHQELTHAKNILAEAGKIDKKQYEVLDIEKELAEARLKVANLERELGTKEGLIQAEESVIDREKKILESEEHKTIPLKDVEDLYEEISRMSFVEKIRERVKEFITERKRKSTSKALQDAEARLAKIREDKGEIEKALSGAIATEKALVSKYEALKKEIDRDKDSGRDAEKAVFRIMSEENELLGKRELLEAKLEKLKVEEAEFKRELEEVGHLVGAEVLRFREAGQTQSPALGQASGKSRSTESAQLLGDQKREIQKLKIRLEDSGLAGYEEVSKEFKETSERDEFLARELEDLKKSAEDLERLIKELGDRITTEFKTGLTKINSAFKTFFADIFGGGEAALKLVARQANEDEGEDKETEEGLDITVSLPRKKIRSLMMLSGGEKALTSIALIFAVSQVNPPPFIILDETDAALDESNSKKYGDMIERLAKHSQLILITHNRETMSRAGVIYGVTMSSGGVSKLLSIEFEEAVQVAK